MATKKNITVNGVLTPVWQTDATAQQIDDAVVAAQNAVLYTAQSLTDTQKTQARGNIGAAPDGYGLGAAAVILTASNDLNNITGNGWYSWGASTPANAPSLISAESGAAYCSMFIVNSTQFVISINDRNNVAMRTNNNEGWTPWEYVNPVLKLGVEYRTTERYKRKPVYCILVNFGLLPDKGIKGLYVDGPTNIEDNIRWSGLTSNGYVLPGGNLYTGWDEIVVRIIKNRIDVKTTTDESTYSATFVLWYTKTTD